jgi:hypothetical protein
MFLRVFRFDDLIHLLTLGYPTNLATNASRDRGRITTPSFAQIHEDSVSGHSSMDSKELTKTLLER